MLHIHGLSLGCVIVLGEAVVADVDGDGTLAG